MAKNSRLILYYVSYGLLCSIEAGINLEDYQDIVVNGNVMSAGSLSDKYVDQGNSRTQWKYGIGFATFSALRGIYPSDKIIETLLCT